MRISTVWTFWAMTLPLLLVPWDGAVGQGIDMFTQDSPAPDSFTWEEPVIRGGLGTLSQLPVAPFRGRTVVNMFGEWTALDHECRTTDGAPYDNGFDTGTFGGGLGRDRLFGKNILCGFGVNAGSIDIKPHDSRYDGSISSLSGNIHAGLFGELWFVDMSLGFGYNWSSNSFEEPGQDRIRNTYGGRQWNYNVDFGLKYQRGYTLIEPLVCLHATSLNETEDTNRFVGGDSTFGSTDNVFTSVRLLTGARFSWEFKTFLATISPRMYVMWQHELKDDALFLTNELTPFPIAYRFGDNVMPRDRVAVTAGATWALRDTVDLFLYYNSTFANDFNGYYLFGGLHKKF